MKYVINAEYWLFKQLDEFAREKKDRKQVIEAYKYIVGKIIEINGKPDLMSGDKYAPYKDYILFDNINQIFYSQGTSLIREIYESLNNMLATDPNYLHQRAKCYIRSAYTASKKTDKKKWLELAYRDANISYMAFERRFENHENDKILISAAHSQYTAALALCHISRCRGYADVEMNNRSVACIYKALKSPFNSLEFVTNDATYNYNNVVNDIITTLSTNLELVSTQNAKDNLTELLRMIIISNS